MADDKEHIDTKIHFTRPTLLVLSGFSGSGKTTIQNYILKKIPDSRFSLSVTTRQQRTDEMDGVDYRFVTKDKFDAMAAHNELLEWEEVHGNYYGTPLKPVEDALKKPCLLLFDIDVYGGLSIKKRFPETILIFLKPPSLDALKKRLKERHTDSPEEIEQRWRRIPREDKMSEHYDHIIVNSSIEQATNEVCDIIREFQKK